MSVNITTSRRRFLQGTGALLASTGILGAPAILRAQTKEIVVGGPGGMAQLMQDVIIPAFESRTGATVLYEGSRSVANLQKLRTGKDAPVMSVVMMDYDIMLMAQKDGLLTPVTGATVANLADVTPKAVMYDGAWINYKVPRVAVGFNSTALPGGVASWAELWTPEYAKRLMLPHLSLTSSANVLAMAAALKTGLPPEKAQYEVDAGFAMLKELKPNVLSIYTNAQQAITLLEQGEAWAIPGEISSYLLSRKAEGAPVDLNKPAEGSFGVPSGIALVKDGPGQDVAQEFISEMLSTEVQTLFAEKYYDSPANTKVVLGADIVPLADLHTTDWEFVSQNRAAWIERFDKEIAA